jgi:hypothetical protein
MKDFTSPKANAYPTSQKPMHPTHASKRFLIRILVEFFYRTDPHSSSANPHYMKKIIAVETRTQTAFMAYLSEYTTFEYGPPAILIII